MAQHQTDAVCPFAGSSGLYSNANDAWAEQSILRHGT